MGPNIAGALGSMTPVFAVLLAIVIVGERIHDPQLLALAAIDAGRAKTAHSIARSRCRGGSPPRARLAFISSLNWREPL